MFATGGDNPPECKHAVNWIKQFLVDFCTPREIKSLSPKAWRKGYSNWAQSHKDPEVRKEAAERMDHSEEVRMTNYSQQQHDKAARWNDRVLQSVLNASRVSSQQDSDGEMDDDVEMAEDREEEVQEYGNTERRSGKKMTRAGIAFSKSEKTLLQRAFCTKSPDGKILPPKGIKNAQVDIALKKYPSLVPIYDRLVASKNGIRSKVNNKIRKSLIPKKKKTR